MDNNELEHILLNELAQMEELHFAMANIAAMMMGDMEEGEYQEDVYWHIVNINRDDFMTMGDPSFTLHFRMTRSTFDNLVEVVGNHLTATYRLQRERTPVAYILMMVLWVLATPDSFRSIALQFGVRPATLHYHYLYMIEVLRELAPRYITWPNARERELIKEAFEERTGFPGVIGCIDGTHINVTAPRYNKARYVNRHDSYSMNTQIGCDDKLLIRDLDVGQCGGKHDASVFSDSALSQSLLEDPTVISFDEHLLGDGGYVLTDSVIIPFRKNGNLTPLQRNYNAIHAPTRVTVENCNARLKMKWRRLLHLHSMHQEIVVDHILASAMLHNFVILNGEEPDDPFEGGEGEIAIALNGDHSEDEQEREEEIEEENEEENEDGDVRANPDHLLTAAKDRAIEKRFHIMRTLPRLFA